MKFFNLKFILCSLALALCSVTYAAALTLDEITSENVMSLTSDDIGVFWSKLQDAERIDPACRIAQFITVKNVCHMDPFVLVAIFMQSKDLLASFFDLITEDTITKFNYNIFWQFSAQSFMKFNSYQNYEQHNSKIIAAITEKNFLEVDFAIITNLLAKEEETGKTSLFEEETGKTSLFKDKINEMLSHVLEKIGFDQHYMIDLMFFSPKKALNLWVLLQFLNRYPSKSIVNSQQQSYQYMERAKLFKNNGKDIFYGMTGYNELTRGYLQNIFEKLQSNPQLCVKMFDVLKQEEKERAKGRYTCIHSHRNDRWVQAMVFKRILEVVLDTIVPEEYYPLRFAKLGAYMSPERRDSLVNTGKGKKTKEIIFMNPSLWSSTFRGTLGGSSMYYFMNNFDQTVRDENFEGVNLNSLFSVYALEKYYAQYFDEFEKLCEDALRDDCGTMLLVSLSQDQLEKSVYSAQIDGFCHNININNKFVKDPKKILDTLRHAPETIHKDDFDHIELCMALCDDPQTGVIHPFSKDPAHIYWYRAKDMSDWLKRLDALFVQIKQDIEVDKQQKIQTQILHNKTSSMNLQAKNRLAVLGAHLMK